MAWEWSHTNEAYQCAFDNLHELPKEELDIIYAEWVASEMINEENEESLLGLGDFEYFNNDNYEIALRATKTMDREALADYIWERMAEQRTCTNGGHQAWACPYGCHLVSFDKEKEEVI